MTIERARVEILPKPWGSSDLRPWSNLYRDGVSIGELWFERATATAQPPALLFKILFTEEALSIQVHPDDAFARSIGLSQGKTEAWVILATKPGAKVAVGLKNRLSEARLKCAIADGTIVDLVQWREVRQGDIVSVPAGTIHAIGPGIVLAEIQQRSDATFRLFDYGRNRELHAANAVAAADAGPAPHQPRARQLTAERTLLVVNPHFVLERIDLQPGSQWELDAECETWFLVLKGDGAFGVTPVGVGEAIFLEQDTATIKVGDAGLNGLVAYASARSSPGLLRLATYRTPAHSLDATLIPAQIVTMAASTPHSPQILS